MDSEPKPRSDATLKNLPEDRQEQIAEWCLKANDVDSETGKPIPKTGGLAYARSQLKADGVSISVAQLGEFFSWWKRRQRYRSALEASEHQRELMEAFRPGDLQLAREWAEYTLLQAANDSEDPKLFQIAATAQDMRRSLDLQEVSGKTKAEQKDRQLALKTEEVAVMKQRFRRDTCKLFLEWLEDKRAKEIASGSGTNADKIEQLGLAMFGEDWAG